MFEQVGKISKAHGLKGEVKVIGNSDVINESFQSELYIKLKEEMIPLTIDSVRLNNDHFIVKFHNLTIDDVEHWKNITLYAALCDLPSLPEDEFYHYELKGKKVYNQHGVVRGFVLDVVAYPQGDYLVIDVGGKKRFVPFIKEFVLSVDEAITINEIEGLL